MHVVVAAAAALVRVIERCEEVHVPVERGGDDGGERGGVAGAVFFWSSTSRARTASNAQGNDA